MEDQTRAIKPNANRGDPAGRNFDPDLDDAMLADQDSEQPGGGGSWNAPPDNDDSAFMTIWRQLSPILVPIPFAVIIFLFALLARARGINDIDPLPLGMILLALVVIQGTALFYASNNNTLWILSIAGGYALFLLVFAYVFFGFGGSLLLLVILVVLTATLGGRLVRVVPEGYVDIVQTFSGNVRTLTPGFNLIFPWEKFQSRQRTREITWTTPPVRIAISRDQEADLVADVRYQLQEDDASIAALQSANWEEDLHRNFLGIIKSVVNELSPADLVGWAHHIHSRPPAADDLANPMVETRWDRLNTALLRRLQDQEADRGILVNLVQVQDITLIPRLAPSILPPTTQPRPVADVGMIRGQQDQQPTLPTVVHATHIPPMSARPAERPAPAPVKSAQVVLPASPPPPAAAPGIALTPPLEARESAIPSKITIQGMIDSYHSVKEQRITDPNFIMNLAARFQAVAKNPEAAAQFPYDAELAANNLLQRANAILLAEGRHPNAPEGTGQAQAPASNPSRVERQRRPLPSLPNENLAQGG